MSIRVKTRRWVAVRVGMHRRGSEHVWQGLAHVEDVRDVLGRWGTWDVHPGGGRGGRGCVPAYMGRPRGHGAVMGVAGRIWERRVSLGVREEAGRLGRVGSASCGPCWGAVARREWPSWWPARGPCPGRVAACQGCVGRVDGAGHVLGGLGGPRGAVWVLGSSSACGACRGASARVWGGSTVCGTCVVHRLGVLDMERRRLVDGGRDARGRGLGAVEGLSACRGTVAWWLHIKMGRCASEGWPWGVGSCPVMWSWSGARLRAAGCIRRGLGGVCA